MAKIDLQLQLELIADDGSIVASGATIKFSSEFHPNTTDIIVRPQIYRSRELFESGYTEVMCRRELPYEIIIKIPDVDEFYQLTPYQLYAKVRDYLNAEKGDLYYLLVTTP